MPIDEKENEIRARIRSPDDFTEIYGYATISEKDGIRAIYGKLQSGERAIQAYRFNKANGWTVEKVGKWLEAHKVETLQMVRLYDVINFEPVKIPGGYYLQGEIVDSNLSDEVLYFGYSGLRDQNIENMLRAKYKFCRFGPVKAGSAIKIFEQVWTPINRSEVIANAVNNTDLNMQVTDIKEGTCLLVLHGTPFGCAIVNKSVINQVQKGDIVTVKFERIDPRSDNGKRWFELVNGEVIAIASALSPIETIDELYWNEKGKGEVMNYNDAITVDDWNKNISLARNDQAYWESLEERILSDKLKMKRSIILEATSHKGRFVSQKHTGTEKFPTHIDLRFEGGHIVESWSIFSDGDCNCKKEICCFSNLKGQSISWLEEHPEFKEHYEMVGKGTYEAGIRTDRVREYFLKEGSLYGKRVVFMKVLNDWMLVHPPDEVPMIFTDRNYTPPVEQSCLPVEVQNKIPVRYHYWKIGDDVARKTCLTALRDAIGKREIRLFSERVKINPKTTVEEATLTRDSIELKAYNFGLYEKNGIKSLKLDMNGESIFFDFGTVIGKTTNLKKGIACDETTMIDKGKILLLKAENNSFKIVFKGRTLRGKYSLLKKADSWLMESDGGDVEGTYAPLTIRGIALTEGVFNGKQYNKDEVSKCLLKPYENDDCVKLRADHSKSAWDIVGKVNRIWFEENHNYKGRSIPAMCFEAVVENEDMAKAIIDGDIDAVSIGAEVDVEPGDPPIVHDIEIHEISLVAVPACSSCRIEAKE